MNPDLVEAFDEEVLGFLSVLKFGLTKELGSVISELDRNGLALLSVSIDLVHTKSVSGEVLDTIVENASLTVRSKRRNITIVI